MTRLANSWCAANEILDPDTWSGPPWTPLQWSVMVGVMRQAANS
jgi:hypothetical protein